MALPAPIAYWPFDEASGPTAADASGNGHTVTLDTGTWDTSALKKFGAAAFKNTDVGRGAAFAPIALGTVHTVAFWLNGWDGSNDGIVLGGASQFYVGYISSGSLYYAAGAGNNVNWAHGGLTGSHHVVVTRSGTTVTLYKDGVVNAALVLGANTAQTLASLSGATDGSFPWVATLDDVRLYDVALSGAQVTELYALVPSAAVETARPYVVLPL